MRNVALRSWLLSLCVAAAGFAAGGCKESNDSGAPSESKVSTAKGALVHCGNVVCRAGRECCNESCGICTEPDVACSSHICKPGDGVGALAPECGGQDKRPCPGEGRCIEGGGAACDPSDGAQCVGTCKCPDSAQCPAGSRWNDAPGVCGCEADESARGAGGQSGGGAGDDDPPAGERDAGSSGGRGGSDEAGSGGSSGSSDAGASGGGGAGASGGGGAGGGGSSNAGSGGSGGSSNAGSGGSGGSSNAGSGGAGSGGGGNPVMCGSVTCASGQYCCNESCEICAPVGDSCSTEQCGPMAGTVAPPPCGSTTCGQDQVCCDPACGLCAASSAACKDVSCTDPGPHPGQLCSDLRCPAGQRCEYVAVTCVTDPCPPEPQCVPYVPCGGFTGAKCPGSSTCIDDYSDNCDPQAGGADCPGLCRCNPRLLPVCKQPLRWDPAPSVCACVAPVLDCIPERACTQF